MCGLERRTGTVITALRVTYRNLTDADFASGTCLHRPQAKTHHGAGSAAWRRARISRHLDDAYAAQHKPLLAESRLITRDLIVLDEGSESFLGLQFHRAVASECLTFDRLV